LSSAGDGQSTWSSW